MQSARSTRPSITSRPFAARAKRRCANASASRDLLEGHPYAGQRTSRRGLGGARCGRRDPGAGEGNGGVCGRGDRQRREARSAVADYYSAGAAPSKPGETKSRRKTGSRAQSEMGRIKKIVLKILYKKPELWHSGLSLDERRSQRPDGRRPAIESARTNRKAKKTGVRETFNSA